MHKSGADGADAEPDGYYWEIPPRTNPFASHVGGDLEDDVGDVKDRKDLVVVVTFHAEILLEAGKPRITYRQPVRPTSKSFAES